MVQEGVVGTPLTVGVKVPQKVCGQNHAFWCILCEENVLLNTGQKHHVTACHGLLRVRDIALIPRPLMHHL